MLMRLTPVWPHWSQTSHAFLSNVCFVFSGKSGQDMIKTPFVYNAKDKCGKNKRNS